MNSCFFCDVFNERVYTEIIFETSNFYVMLNEHKLARGGPLCMVVSKEHIPYIYDLDVELCAELMTTLVKTSNLLRKTYNAKGIRIWIKNGKKAGQTIEHLHFHVMPSNSSFDFPLILLKFTYNIVEGYFVKRRKIMPSKLKFIANQLRSNLVK